MKKLDIRYAKFDDDNLAVEIARCLNAIGDVHKLDSAKDQAAVMTYLGIVALTELCDKKDKEKLGKVIETVKKVVFTDRDDAQSVNVSMCQDFKSHRNILIPHLLPFTKAVHKRSALLSVIAHSVYGTDFKSNCKHIDLNRMAARDAQELGDILRSLI